MKIHFTEDWLRRKIEECGEPEGCAKCGAIAGCCNNYPTCQEEIKMTTMRAKMTVQGVTRTSYSEELKFGAEYSNSKEDNSYSEATPSGSITLQVTNKALHGKFNPGDKFYVDFTPAE